MSRRTSGRRQRFFGEKNKGRKENSEKRGEEKGQMDVIRWLIENSDVIPEQAMQAFVFPKSLVRK